MSILGILYDIMLINKSGRLVKSLDFRGTKIEYLDRLSAKELLLIITSAQQSVNLMEKFKARELAPTNWSGTVYQPIMDAASGDRAMALRLFGVVIKQALIMTPLLFTQSSDDDWEAATYTKETLDF